MNLRAMGVAVVVSSAGLACADEITRVGFESGNHGWLANGQPNIQGEGGNPDSFLELPYGDYWSATLRNDSAGPATGDLTRYNAPLRFSVDLTLIQLHNFFGDPLDPSHWPLVLEFVDYDGGSPVSVYFTAASLPPQGSGWHRYTIDIPDPTQAALPAGWGGTGDEDPQTFEPRLPPDRTYRSVMEGVDEVRLTTMRPGYFYGANFWHVGYDNVVLETTGGGPTCDPDVNCDGVPDQGDVACMILAVAGDTSCYCQPDTDFNRDGVPDQGDVADVILAVAGAPCP